MQFVVKCQLTGLDWFYDAENKIYKGFDAGGKAKATVFGKYLPNDPKSPSVQAIVKHWCETNANTNDES